MPFDTSLIQVSDGHLVLLHGKDGAYHLDPLCDMEVGDYAEGLVTELFRDVDCPTCMADFLLELSRILGIATRQALDPPCKPAVERVQ